jgi:hypothetical protein
MGGMTMRRRLMPLSAAIGLTLGLIAALALGAQTPASKLNDLNGRVVAQSGQTPFSKQSPSFKQTPSFKRLYAVLADTTGAGSNGGASVRKGYGTNVSASATPSQAGEPALPDQTGTLVLVGLWHADGTNVSASVRNDYEPTGED